MTPFESTRANLMGKVLAFHTASYSTMQVNYPDHLITDFENAVEFVMVEVAMDLKQLDMALPLCARVKGQLVLFHYRRSGGGKKPFTTYSDALFSYFGLKTLDGITYQEVRCFNKSGKPGFDGTMNVIDFQVDYFN